MIRRDVVLVGASAGGVEALRVLLAGLPSDLPATVLVVVHVAAGADQALAHVLDRSSALPVRTARDGDRLTPGRVLVGGPDRHVFVTPEGLTLSAGPRENGHRPSVDVLFRSAARALGPRCTGVVLSGNLDDGTAGLVAVRAAGGLGVVQDPADAAFPSMPTSAATAAHPEHVVPVGAMAALLDRLVREPVSVGAAPQPESRSRPSGYSCPVCAGVLWRSEDGPLLGFRCRVGHAWAPDSLLVQQETALEAALWTALRGLEERAALVADLAEHAREHGRPALPPGTDRRALDAGHAARVLRTLLARSTPGPEADHTGGQQP